MIWILGPQLIGIVMIIVGIIQKRYPPKSINGLYGFRTASAMQNQQTWNEANNYSAHIMLKFGFIALLIGLAMSVTLHLSDVNLRVLGLIQMVTTLITAFIVAGCVIHFTHKRLKKVFGENLNHL